uniref:Uncharacterized protein n=1 Tax=Oryza barthii TaxID=65489 RepID=A0A0D3GYS3_9ORYZ
MQKMRTVLIEHALANSEAERNVNTSVFAKVAMFEEELRAALPREVEATRAAWRTAPPQRRTGSSSAGRTRSTGAQDRVLDREEDRRGRPARTGTPHVERHRTTSTSVPLLLTEKAVEHERHHTARARSHTLMQKMRTVLIEHALANSEAERNVNISVFAKVAMRSSARRCPGKWRLPRAAMENGTATKVNRITKCRSYSLYRFVRKELGTEYLTGEKIDAVARRGREQGVRRHERGQAH